MQTRRQWDDTTPCLESFWKRELTFALQDIHYQRDCLIFKGPLTLYSQIKEKFCKTQAWNLVGSSSAKHRHEIQLPLESHHTKICLNDFRHCMRLIFFLFLGGERCSLLPSICSGKITQISLSTCNAVILKVWTKLWLHSLLKWTLTGVLSMPCF